MPYIFFCVVQMASAVQCGMNLKAIGSHFSAYQVDCNNSNPQSLVRLVEYSGLSKSKLICPTCVADEVYSSSYVYRGNDLNGNMPKDMVLAYERYPNHKTNFEENIPQKILKFLTFNSTSKKYRHVLFSGNTVRYLTEVEFLRYIEEDNKIRKSLSLPEKSITHDINEEINMK